MSLSERLARAARVREGLIDPAGPRIAATPTSTWTARAGQQPSAEPRGVPHRDVTIVLAPQHTVAAVAPDPSVPLDATCPTCGRTGELGLVDLARRSGDWSCEACGTMWRVVQPAGAHDELAPPVR